MTLDDTDPMPFGLHRGIPMQDVPSKYLHWWWCNCRPPTNEKGLALQNYIAKSLDALKQENTDLIWPL